MKYIAKLSESSRIIFVSAVVKGSTILLKVEPFEALFAEFSAFTSEIEHAPYLSGKNPFPHLEFIPVAGKRSPSELYCGTRATFTFDMSLPSPFQYEVKSETFLSFALYETIHKSAVSLGARVMFVFLIFKAAMFVGGSVSFVPTNL